MFFSPGAFLSYLRHRSAHPTLSYIRIRPQARTADGYRTGGGRRRQRFDTTSVVSDSCPSWLAGASLRRRRSWCPSPSQRNFPAQAPEPPPQSREGQVLRSDAHKLRLRAMRQQQQQQSFKAGVVDRGACCNDNDTYDHARV